MSSVQNPKTETERSAVVQRDIDHIVRICARGRDVITLSGRMSRRSDNPLADIPEMMELITLIER